MTFLKLFGRLKSVVIGMIHVKALPGKTHLNFFFKKVALACALRKVFSGGGSIHFFCLLKVAVGLPHFTTLQLCCHFTEVIVRCVLIKAV